MQLHKSSPSDTAQTQKSSNNTVQLITPVSPKAIVETYTVANAPGTRTSTSQAAMQLQTLSLPVSAQTLTPPVSPQEQSVKQVLLQMPPTQTSATAQMRTATHTVQSIQPVTGETSHGGGSNDSTGPSCSAV